MRSEYPNLIALLADIVRKHPERTAIKDHTRFFTYSQLFQRASGVADVLCMKGVGIGDHIVCISKKDTESLICFWGILLSGGIPVMLDYEDGKGANSLKISAVAPAVVILDKSDQINTEGIPPFVSLEFAEVMRLSANSHVRQVKSPDVLPETCYILLTSGTSGTPKAVQVSHRNVLHYTRAIYERLGSPENVRAAHVTTFAADLGLTNLLVALMSGGMLRILDRTEATDPAIFYEVMEKDEISLLKITPSHLLSLITDLKKTWHTVITNIVLGGEKLNWEGVQTIYGLNICRQLYNHYGPTETTVGAMVFKVEPSYNLFNITGSVPIGKPIGEGFCRLANESEGIGELCIGGPGVSMGYLNNPGATGEKFKVAMFATGEALFYHTGDICRKLEDGNYEFLYRNDRQVKINGHRIELGEIEVLLATHPDIENAIAIATAEAVRDHSVLELYIKPALGRTMGKEMLRNWLKERLPVYKMPAEIYFYTDVPYNSNGKIDMQALKMACKAVSEPVPASITHLSVAEGNDWEKLVAEVWGKVLHKETACPDDNFFETGGDSLLAIQLIGKLQRYGYKVHITDLNHKPVFGDFLKLQPVKISGEESQPIKRHNVNSFTCSQYLFLHREAFPLNEYCQAMLLETSDKIQIREMAQAINCVLRSHAQLNTMFRKNETAYVGVRGATAGLTLGTTVLDDQTATAGQIQEVAGHLLKEISVEKGKLFTAHVFVGPVGKDHLYLACHHMVVDAISWNIITDELLEYYEMIVNGNYPVITMENAVDLFFKELTVKQPSTLSARPDRSPRQLYHLPVMSDTEEQHDLIEVFNIVIPEEIATGLQRTDEQKRSAGIGGVLLSAFAAAVMETCELSKMSIDLEFHGRPQRDDLPDISRSVAWWAVTMPVNLQYNLLSPAYCNELIDEEAIAANSINLHHHHYPYVHTEKPDIRFNYLGHYPDRFGNSVINFVASPLNPGPTRSRYALQEYALFFTARFQGGALIVDIQYRMKKVPQQYVENMVRLFSRKVKEHLYEKENSAAGIMPRVLQSNLPTVGLPLLAFNKNSTYIAARYPRTVFLTGATGFLGAHLLKELLNHDDVLVYCLVRGDNERHATERLEECMAYYFTALSRNARNRVKIIHGDLLSENMGIENQEYEKLTHSVDIVLHAAADVNLMKDFSQLRHTNITATANIVNMLSSGKKKQVHYISTLAVSGYLRDGGQRRFSETDFDYGQSFISDYERTKFEAEKIIRDFLEQGEQGKIYRVGHIAADSVSGKFQKNMDQNRIFQIIKGSLLLGLMPVEYDERIAFSYVDIVARGVVSACLGITNTPMKCMHIENPESLSFHEISRMLRQMGYNVRMTGLTSFREAVTEFEGKRTDKRCVDIMNTWIQRALDYPRQLDFVQKASLDALAVSGLYFPKADFRWFLAMITESVNSGYLYAPAENIRDSIKNSTSF